ncbi:MAG: hypothetical protein K0U20_08940 [Proteobacteria bacterium]|nr:hypothetical protein [Pseudomonadota bacterium]
MRGRHLCECGKYYASGLNCPKCSAPEWASTFVPFNPLDWTFDIETYPNICTFDFKHLSTGNRVIYEISDRVNQSVELYNFLNALAGSGCRMVGFNNVGFDYPVIHFFIEYFHTGITYVDIYNKAQQIINTPWQNRYDNVIWDNDVHITQIDLFRVHHFDNDARRTSLKMIEFNLCMDSIEDLPFPPGTVLNNAEKDVLIKYNDHDVDATELFLIESIEMIEFREQLGEKYNANYLNHNDKKIGTSYLINELERQLPGSCYTRVNGRKAPRQTIRQMIALADVIFPYIQFKEPEFERVKQWLASQVITETKGIFSDLSATINGFKYDFGTGGIHGSIDSTIVESDDDFELWDWDVASYYPNLAIKNKLYPEHLSEQFCTIYNDIYIQRGEHKKGTALNRALKLALNGAYGDSNSKYSPFYDPKFTMGITINGQLLLCMLAQYLIDIPGLTMVQINTDGLTVRCPRKHIEDMKTICKWWEGYTCLELESVIYSRMFIRDVNNYIAEKPNGSLKRKGAYAYERILDNPDTMDRQWHQNHSALIVPKAAEAALVHGQDIRDFIENHDNIFDYMLRTKVGRADELIHADAFGNKKSLQKITRYYISNAADAGSLTKVSPPTKGAIVGQWKRANGLTDQFYAAVRTELQQSVDERAIGVDLDATGLPWDERINTKNRSKYDTRRTGLNVGYLSKPCNDIRTARRDDINFDYYVAETEKLVNPLRE